MRLKYYISSGTNSLYNGSFLSWNRYKTFGQHSFIYDFAACAARADLQLDMIIENSCRFPLTIPLGRHARITEYVGSTAVLETAQAAILDTVSSELLNSLPKDLPAVCVVHNAGTRFSQDLIDRCDAFICMTENSIAYQSRLIDPAKLFLIHQGVDLRRFVPQHVIRQSGRPKILFYTRLSEGKQRILTELLSLICQDFDITVLGDGEFFWDISDTFGDQATILNFVPCHSIHRFLPLFDVVVSCGRGVMEAAACGIPVLCAGLDYAGILSSDNISNLLRYNLTGHTAGRSTDRFKEDVCEALAIDRSSFRSLAEEFLDGDRFISETKTLISRFVT